MNRRWFPSESASKHQSQKAAEQQNSRTADPDPDPEPQTARPALPLPMQCTYTVQYHNTLVPGCACCGVVRAGLPVWPHLDSATHAHPARD